jgi:hypothetical protein
MDEHTKNANAWAQKTKALRSVINSMKHKARVAEKLLEQMDKEFQQYTVNLQEDICRECKNNKSTKT